MVQVPTSLSNQHTSGQNDVYGFDTLSPNKPSQNEDVYGFDKLTAPNSRPQNDIYSFDKLTPTATSQSTSPRFPPPTSNRAKVPLANTEIYSFDQLAPSTPRKKSNSGSVKEDMQHVQYARAEEQSDYGFDHLVVKKEQKFEKKGYDTVPPPKLKSPSPLGDDDQEEYIEPIDEEILKEIKGEQQTYDRLLAGKDQTHDRIPGPPSASGGQAPPKLPAKKRSFPPRGASYELLGGDDSCPVNEKV